MPSNIHEVTVDCLTYLFRKELNRVAEKDSSLQENRNKLRCSGRAGIFTGSGSLYPDISPDAQFRYRGVYGANFIIEIAYAATKADLKAKVIEYFQWVPEVRAILTIDINYLSPHQRREGRKHSATVALWLGVREGDSVFIDSLVDHEVFLQDGVARPGELQIPFKFFLPPEARTNGPAEDIALIFRYEDLAGMIEEAEDLQRSFNIKREGPPPKPQIIQYVDIDGKLLWTKDKNGEIVPADEEEEPQAKRPKVN
ncbi:hypothetical protein F4680DRAFT_6136 [Xylaria scruposa]|nr:hypothetical protein F4680DRAFT_6136 [Xylaria scruposa]